MADGTPFSAAAPRLKPEKAKLNHGIWNTIF
jgi:hypothetical protein